MQAGATNGQGLNLSGKRKTKKKLYNVDLNEFSEFRKWKLDLDPKNYAAHRDALNEALRYAYCKDNPEEAEYLNSTEFDERDPLKKKAKKLLASSDTVTRIKIQRVEHAKYEFNKFQKRTAKQLLPHMKINSKASGRQLYLNALYPSEVSVLTTITYNACSSLLPAAGTSAPSTMGAAGKFPTTGCANDDELAAFDAGSSDAETSGAAVEEEMPAPVTEEEEEEEEEEEKNAFQFGT